MLSVTVYSSINETVHCCLLSRESQQNCFMLTISSNDGYCAPIYKTASEKEVVACRWGTRKWRGNWRKERARTHLHADCM